MIFYCQSCGEQQLQTPTSAAIDLTRCKCGSSSFATWQPSFLATQPAPSQTGTPRTDSRGIPIRSNREWREIAEKAERELAEVTEWYDAAMKTSNEAGYAGIDAAGTIKALAAELSQAKRDAERLVKLLVEARDNLIWCGGSADFGHNGQAKIGYDKGPRVTITAIADELDAALAKREGEGREV